MATGQADPAGGPERDTGELTPMSSITLPEAEQMLKRLVEVDENPHLVERFYPLLVREAGKKKALVGVTMMLHLAIHDYCRGMPPILAALLRMRGRDYVAALLGDQPRAAARACSLWEDLSRPRDA